MSLNDTQTIKCPHCKEESEITVWQSVTVSDSPDLKEDLLKGKLNMFKCRCGYSALFPAPMLYNDEDKKLLISFAPENDAKEKLRLFKEIKETSHNSGELSKYPDYNLRFVASYNELLEKILIFDNGLHDKVVEVIKLLVLSQEPEKEKQRICIFGKLDEDAIEFMVQDRVENQVYTSRVPLSTYETIAAELKKSGVKYKSFDWEIIDIDYAKTMLYGANNTL